MTINSPAAPIWAMYIVAAEKAGVPRAQLEGTLQNDILKEFIAQKEFLFPPEPSIRRRRIRPPERSSPLTDFSTVPGSVARLRLGSVYMLITFFLTV